MEMMEHESFKEGVSESVLARGEDPQRPRSSHRIHYEAQVEVIRRQIGELENIRGKLGLSQRKICQLLMVDPSAWTRWTKKGDSAPPHIYRALQWYMILQEKIPGLTPQYFVGKDPEVLHQAALSRIQVEASKRREFEEALSVQSLKMEEKLQELSLQNQDLIRKNQSLDQSVSQVALKLKIVSFALGLSLMALACFWGFRG